ncbi:MAG: hypothetical protein HN488_08215 [Saprospiraceae bacterium]|jgi:hypothetical protein|nr:hypothetical protein [Saprospiraceae bacterium]
MKQKTNVLMEIEEEIENREFPFDFSELDEEYCDSCKCFLPWYAGTSYDTHYLGRIDLCKLCKPWVKNSFYDVPSHYKGFTIYDVPLFIKILDSINMDSSLAHPGNGNFEWAKLLDKVLPELDYVTEEKTRRYYNTNHVLYPTYSIIRNLITEYKQKVLQIEKDYRTFLNSGVSHLQNFDSKLPEALVIGHNEIIINPKFMHSSSPIAIINGVKINKSSAAYNFFQLGSVSDNERFAQLVFEEINNFSNIELSTRVKQTMLEVEFLKDHGFTDFGDFTPTMPYLINQLASILSGKRGILSKYKLLAIILIVEKYKPYKVANDLNTHFWIWRDSNVWARSIQFLGSIIDSLGSRAIIEENYIVVEGISGTNYVIVPESHMFQYTFWGVYAFDPKEPVHLGPKEPEYWVDWDEYFEMEHQYKIEWQQRHICIELPYHRNRGLPIGDYLAALVLALSNDLISKNKISTLNSYFSSNKFTEENR